MEKFLVCSLASCFHPWSWHHLALRHFLLFSKNIYQILQGRAFTVTNFFGRHLLCRFYQNISCIGDCLVMESVVGTKGILVDRGKKLTMSADFSSLLFFYVYRIRAIAIYERPNVKHGYSMKFPWTALYWFLTENYFSPLWYHWCPIETKCYPNHVVYWYNWIYFLRS